MGDQRVLVVDDDPDYRFLVRLALAPDSGFEVVAEAGDGAAAVVAAEQATARPRAARLHAPRRRRLRHAAGPAGGGARRPHRARLRPRPGRPAGGQPLRRRGRLPDQGDAGPPSRRRARGPRRARRGRGAAPQRGQPALRAGRPERPGGPPLRQPGPHRLGRRRRRPHRHRHAARLRAGDQRRAPRRLRGGGVRPADPHRRPHRGDRRQRLGDLPPGRRRATRTPAGAWRWSAAWPGGGASGRRRAAARRSGSRSVAAHERPWRHRNAEGDHPAGHRAAGSGTGPARKSPAPAPGTAGRARPRAPERRCGGSGPGD